LSENQAFLAADLYSKGSSFKEVGAELGVSKSKVGDLIREGIFSLANGVEEPEAVPIVLSEEERGNRGNFGGLIGGEPDVDGLMERTLLINATPILRKVVLNSKVFLQHEYFQKHLGYEGDVGDLLIEALNFYWKELGFTIKITHDSVM
jgi:hypothetical protein